MTDQNKGKAGSNPYVKFSAVLPAGQLLAPRLIDLDPKNWEHAQLAVAIYVERNGPLCTKGHRMLQYGRFWGDHRVRCEKCSSDRVAAMRRRKTAERRALRQQSAGERSEPSSAARKAGAGR